MDDLEIDVGALAYLHLHQDIGETNEGLVELFGGEVYIRLIHQLSGERVHEVLLVFALVEYKKVLPLL